MNDFPLISIDIQISENETSKLEIFDENEDIKNKVDEFCKKHNFSDKIKLLLEEKVFEQLETQINQIQQSLNNSEENNHLETINSLSNIENEIDPNEFLFTDNPPLIPTLNGKNNNKFSYNNNKSFDKNSFDLKGGEKLYFIFKEKLLKKKEIQNKILQEKIEEENKNLSFHPNISQYSKFLARNYSEEPIENRLINYGIKQKEKNLKLKTQKDLKNNINETFMPKIPESSKILGKNKRKNRIENLNYDILNNVINSDYVELTRNKSSDCIKNNNRIASFSNNNNNENIFNKKNKISSQRTTVNTNYSSKINSQRVTEGNYNNNNNNNYNNNIEEKKSFIFQNKIPVPILKPEKNIFDYLYLESKIIKEKKEKDFEENIKKNCSFSPFIPQKVRNLVKNRKETTTEFLNRMTRKKNFEINEIVIKKNEINRNKSKNRSKNKTIKSKEKNKENNEINTQKKKNIFLENTQKIILKMKIEKFQEIFNLLDSDSDGLISNNKILLSNINAELLLALSPIFEELQNNTNISMNFKQFCLKADKLLTPIIFSNIK